MEVFRGGVPCSPQAPKQRALLAILLLHHNQVLPTDTIIDMLWAQRPPRSASAALQMHVCGVRRHIGGGGHRHPVLRTETRGYSIRLRPDQLDLAVFRELARAGRRELAAGRCADAGDRFDAALRQWQGLAMAGVAAAGPLANYAVHLEAERLAVHQQRIGVDLCQGAARQAVGELAELCDRHPTREDLHQQYMVALSAVGRTADALRVYTRLRAAVVAEAGIEPGPGLRATHQAVLRGEPAVDPGHSCGRTRVAGRLP
ncbi:AfsR/SARP family transcriptional regulator [Actinokineospora pegani]|uniref:AfsR/SARP family transcriptional regulator n=1 Tax=Actinokineospora pegani TaxID=2654637 RepID=UPI0018D351C0|nr:AfsR/SARP family transcriptional regulator [Actinokineospora pegani]